MFGWRKELLSKIVFFADWSIRKKLLVALIPVVVTLLMVTGFVTHHFAAGYLGQSLERTSRIYTMAQAHNVEVFLRQAADDLRLLSRTAEDKDDLVRFMEGNRELHGEAYRELALAASSGGEAVLLLNTGEAILDLPSAHSGQIKNSPLDLPSRMRDLKPGNVHLVGLTDSVYPLTLLPAGTSVAPMGVFRLITPLQGRDGTSRGYLVLSLDAREVRNILSVFNSPKSPLYAFPRTSEKRYSFFFDDQGWILFQSENPEDSSRELSGESARAGMSGSHGKPGYDRAFRPSPKHEIYWRMVVDAQAGNSGLEAVNAQYEPSEADLPYYLGYCPVRFASDLDKEPEVVGGVAYMDRTRLSAAAEFRQMDVMFVITIAAIIITSVVIYVLGRAITNPIFMLVAEVQGMMGEEVPHEIVLPDADMETTLLKRSINSLIDTLLHKDRELLLRNEDILRNRLQERVDLDSLALASGAGPTDQRFPGIVGASPVLLELKQRIQKAAQTDADVLIVGETGTGKELTAEAIHQASSRGGRPFITINCGALDENLLLDELFGHVKGAFSEAKADRKGAFLAAHGGTLFLDEIGNASAKVQQALLRTLSVRRITPLGSDQDINVDVRVLAATNVDLQDSVQRGEFREDLYYRLKVISVETPPLRVRKTDIPLLAAHFLRQAASMRGGADVSLSRGALAHLHAHDWPGNVRELKNTLTRAVAMAERGVLFAEDLLMSPSAVRTPPRAETEASPPAGGYNQTPPAPSSLPPSAAEVYGLNTRQQKAMEYLRAHGSITRRQYQDLLGQGVPPRTAQHDLKDMVSQGLLKKTGNGPATGYVLA